jgi:hypothetical protein
MVRAAWMEKIMSKTHTLEHHRGLDAVSVGFVDIGTTEDDELYNVTGGALGYEGQPVVTYSLLNAWPDPKLKRS